METNSNKFLDLSLKCEISNSFDTFVVGSDGFVFKARMTDLSERSGYFKAFFEENAFHRWNNNTGIISINLKFSKSILAKVLQFLYSGEIRLSQTNVCDLAKAADFLQIDDLVKKCSDFMLKSISLDNCVSFLTASYFLQRLRIKECCFRFVCVNFHNILLKRYSDVSKLPFVALRDLIEENSLRVTDEYDVWKAVASWVESDRSTRFKYVPELLARIRWTEICKDVELLQVIKVSENELKQVVERFPRKIYLFSRRASNRKRSSEVSGIKDGLIREIYITYDEKLDMCRKITEMPLDVKDCFFIAGQFLFQFSAMKNFVKAYDLVRKEWIDKNPVLTPLGSTYYVRWKNSIFAVPEILSILAHYDPSKDIWINSASLPALVNHATTVIRDRLCVVGYRNKNATAVVYDPFSDVWSYISAPQTLTQINFALISFRDRLYILGGVCKTNRKETGRVLEYRPETDEWANFPPLPIIYNYPRAVIIQDKLIVHNTSFTSGDRSCNIWNEETEAWDVLNFSPLEIYTIGSIEDESLLKTLSKQNKDPRTVWDTSINVTSSAINNRLFN